MAVTVHTIALAVLAEVVEDIVVMVVMVVLLIIINIKLLVLVEEAAVVKQMVLDQVEAVVSVF